MDRSTLMEMTAGAAVMFGFGIIWLLVGLLLGRPSPSWLRLAILFVGVAVGASILTLGLRTSRLPPSTAPLTVQQVAANRLIVRGFYLVSGIEFAAIFLAVVVLRALHYPDYILCGVAFIVGVHFFPLAPLFRAPVYYGTGVLGCAIAFVGFFMADAVLARRWLEYRLACCCG